MSDKLQFVEATLSSSVVESQNAAIRSLFGIKVMDERQTEVYRTLDQSFLKHVGHQTTVILDFN